MAAASATMSPQMTELGDVMGKAGVVLEMMDNELESVLPEPHTDVFTPPDTDSNRSFHGVPGFTFSSLTHQSFFTTGCPEAFVFWISRPVWFVATRKDLVDIRLCIEDTVDLLRSHEFNATLIPVLTALIPVAYSARSERILRSGRIRWVDQRPPTTRFVHFHSFMASHPRIHRLLKRSTSVVDRWAPLAVSETDIEFLGVMDTKLSFGVHLVDMVDAYWQAAVERDGHGGSMLPYWQMLAERRSSRTINWDTIQVDFFSDKSVSMDIEETFRRLVTMGNFSRLESSVGALLAVLWSRSTDGIKGCLPNTPELDAIDLANEEGRKQLFEFIGVNLGAVAPMYRCIADEFESRPIRLPDDTLKAERASTIMHMVRVATSPAAMWLSLNSTGSAK